MILILICGVASRSAVFSETLNKSIMQLEIDKFMRLEKKCCQLYENKHLQTEQNCTTDLGYFSTLLPDWTQKYLQLSFNYLTRTLNLIQII